MYNFSTSKRGETLVSVIIGVVILAIALWGATMILIQSYDVEEEYHKNNTLMLLEYNAENIVRKIDTSSILEWDIFFIHKDLATKTFNIFTGSVNEQYKYINWEGESVTNTGSYDEIIYTRFFRMEQWDNSFWELKKNIVAIEISELIKK